MKGAIDSTIAEEQARQNASQLRPSRSDSSARRISRTGSPAVLQRLDRDGAAKVSDPSDFEKDLDIDLPISIRAQTRGEEEIDDGVDKQEAQPKEKAHTYQAISLPTDVRSRLRKLDRLEPRYKGRFSWHWIFVYLLIELELLRSYRIAHTRVQFVEPFEAALRENTPLTSINDTAALIEYLNQVNVKSNMVMDELKRVSMERDSYKQKVEETSREESHNQTRNREHLVENPKDSANIEKPGKALEIPASEELFSYDDELVRLETELREREVEVKALQADLSVARESGASMAQSLEAVSKEVSEQRSTNLQLLARSETFESIVSKLRSQLEQGERRQMELSEALQQKEELLEALGNRQVGLGTSTLPDNSSLLDGDSAREASAREISVGSAGDAKKKSKRKRKGGNPKVAIEKVDAEGAKQDHVEKTQLTGHLPLLQDLQQRILSLTTQLEEKEDEILKFRNKLQSEGNLQEAVENLQKDLINIRQEHLQAKDRIRSLVSGKKSLEKKITELETDLPMHAANEIDTHATELEDNRTESIILQADLAASEKLAASRYKENIETQNLLQSAHTEVISLREEVGSLRSAKEDIVSKVSKIEMLESRQTQLQDEVTNLQVQISERDLQIKTLREKILQESNARVISEDARRLLTGDLRKLQSENQAVERKLRDVSNMHSAKARNLEELVAKLTTEKEMLREEMESKTEQHVNVQDLMRDQITEMGMQVREAVEKSESLEEEVTHADRLLSERAREAETMRRLLAESESRTDVKVRGMHIKLMEVIEERDRAEDEASTLSRKMARESEELKTKLRVAERGLTRAKEEREDLEKDAKDWRKKQEELHDKAERSSTEVEDMRKAMNELRDALDDSEHQIRDLEKQRTDLQRKLEDTRRRSEKPQKAYQVCKFSSLWYIY